MKKLFAKIFLIVIAACISTSAVRPLAAASDMELTKVIVAMSDNESIIVERVLYEALKRSGYNMTVQVTGMRTAISEVNSGNAAILPLQTGGWDESYENLIKVPVAIDNVEYTAYMNKTGSRVFTEWDDMAGLKLGYRWQNQYIAENIHRAKAGELFVADTFEELWDSLISGTTDVVILPRMPHFEYRTPGEIRKAGVVESEEVYTYVNSAYADLAPLLENAYREMLSEGTIDRIHKSIDANGDKKTVLHINSYSEQVEWERAQMETLREILEADAAVSYHSINLNSNQPHNQARQNDVVSDLVRSAFVENYPDLIISSGDEAFEFVLDKWQFLFPTVPVVFFGVRNLDESSLYGFEEHITGITEKDSYHENVSEMLRLFPETQQIYVLNDNNVPRSITLRNKIQECVSNHDLSVDYIYSENKPLTDILKDISGFGPDTLILIGSYLLGGDAMYYSETYIQKQVVAASNGPVFCMVSSFVGNGILGGRVSGTDEYINVVSAMAAEVLSGRPPASIPIIHDSDHLNRWQFDYETLKRFNISHNVLPADHIIINQPREFWNTNPLEFKLTIVVALLFLLIIVGLIVFSRVLSKKQAEAAAASGAKTVFLAKMSHEIRTPMNAILGMTELAIRENDLFEVRNHMRTVKQSATMLLSIINDILDFSKIESDTMEITTKDYLLSSLVQDVVSIIRMKMDDSGIQFMVHVDSQIPNKLIGDEVRIRQVLINLLNNAVKFTKKGFIALNIHGEVIDERTVVLTMEVKDSGRGIKQEDVDKLFCEYYQVDKTNRYTDGVGLGLPITARLINAMGGNISIDSEYGTGSTFTVTLDQTIRVYERIATVINAGKERILVYERSELYADSIANTITNMEVDCSVAANESDFQNKLADSEYTWLFISSELYEANKAMISKKAPEAKIVLLTTINDVIASERLRSLTMPAYSVQVANILNGISDNFSYDNEVEPVVRFTAPNARVLVVDDVKTNLMVAKGFLLSHLIQVDTCGSGVEAIEELKSKEHDLVLMDHRMPVMDGMETTKRIRAMGKSDPYYANLPIIALTANAIMGVGEVFLANGFNDYISKPVDIDHLSRTLEKWIPDEKKGLPSPKRVDKEPEKTELGSLKIAGLDTEKGLALSGGGKEYYIEMLATFIEDSVERTAEIKSCLEKSDFGMLKTHVHALKGASASIGATRLPKLAQALENAAASLDIEYIETHADKYVDELDLLVDKIQKALPALQKTEANDKKPFTNSLKEELGTLKEALNNMEIAVMNRSIDKLIKFPKTKELAGIASKIANSILMADYEKAKELTNTMLSKV